MRTFAPEGNANRSVWAVVIGSMASRASLGQDFPTPTVLEPWRRRDGRERNVAHDVLPWPAVALIAFIFRFTSQWIVGLLLLFLLLLLLLFLVEFLISTPFSARYSPSLRAASYCMRCTRYSTTCVLSYLWKQLQEMSAAFDVDNQPCGLHPIEISRSPRKKRLIPTGANDISCVIQTASLPLLLQCP